MSEEQIKRNKQLRTAASAPTAESWRLTQKDLEVEIQSTKDMRLQTYQAPTAASAQKTYYIGSEEELGGCGMCFQDSIYGRLIECGATMAASAPSTLPAADNPSPSVWTGVVDYIDAAESVPAK